MDLLAGRLFQIRMLSTVNTLQSLERLLEQNSEIVVLPAVGLLVHRSAESLRAAQQHLARGRFEAALLAITQAMQLADAAFFHPTMMAHQYFPDEHKLGVYLPLFFPFVLPIAIATLLGSVAYFKAHVVK
jgi:phosphatidylinositol glycan class S